MTEAEPVTAPPEDSAARIAELEAQLKRVTLHALRTQIAAETGLSPKLADRLQGESEADLRRDAESLRSLAAAPRTTTTPVPTGEPPGESDAQRRARLFGGASLFTSGRMVYHSDPADLDAPV